MKRIIVVLTVMVLMMVVSALPVFAQEGACVVPEQAKPIGQHEILLHNPNCP